jgi:hypothetical protein
VFQKRDEVLVFRGFRGRRPDLKALFGNLFEHRHPGVRRLLTPGERQLPRRISRVPPYFWLSGEWWLPFKRARCRSPGVEGGSE